MFRSIKSIYKPSFFQIDKNGNLVNPVVIDQYSVQSFNLNRFGWPESDVMAILRAESLQVQDRIMSRLQLVKSDPRNKDKTDKELLQDLIPKNCQSYGELSAFMKWYYDTYGESFFQPDGNISEVDEKKVDAVDEPASPESSASSK